MNQGTYGYSNHPPPPHHHHCFPPPPYSEPPSYFETEAQNFMGLLNYPGHFLAKLSIVSKAVAIYRITKYRPQSTPRRFPY